MTNPKLIPMIRKREKHIISLHVDFKRKQIVKGLPKVPSSHGKFGVTLHSHWTHILALRKYYECSHSLRTKKSMDN